jgi:CRISPR system Cascade subunit CasE
MAFPSDPRKERDPDFLAPYMPDDFPEQRHLADKKKKDEVDEDILKQVHKERGRNSGFLFRIDPYAKIRAEEEKVNIDPYPGGRAVIIVQSAGKPDWEYAFHNAGYLLAAPPEWKSFDPSFTKGQRFRFCLVANPTKKIDTINKKKLNNCAKEKFKGRHGRRVPVPTDRLLDWLASKDREDSKPERSGFSIDNDSTTVQPGYVYVNKTGEYDGQYWKLDATEFALSDKSCKFCRRPEITSRHNCSAIKQQRDGKRGKHGQRLRSVRYEGVLEVTDADCFHKTLIRGIGPGKAFGFGLLSVARVDYA